MDRNSRLQINGERSLSRITKINWLCSPKCIDRLNYNKCIHDNGIHTLLKELWKEPKSFLITRSVADQAFIGISKLSDYINKRFSCLKNRTKSDQQPKQYRFDEKSCFVCFQCHYWGQTVSYEM